MKRVNIIIAILLVFILSGCSNGVGSIQDEGIIQGQDQENVDDDNLDAQVQENAELQEERRGILVGSWNAGSKLWLEERYHFYDDGTFLFEYGYSGLERRISESGTWDIENDALKLTVNKTVSIEGGEEVETVLPDGLHFYSINNGKIKSVDIASSNQKEYIENDFFNNMEESVGDIKVVINGERYQKLHDDPNTYQNKRQYEDGDDYRAGSEETVLMIGTWYGSPSVGSADSDRYHFYDDGTYLYEFSNYDTMSRVRSESGTWEFENNKLTLIVNSKVIIEGGDEAEPLLVGDPNKYQIKNGSIKIIEVDHPEEREYVVNSIYQDTEEKIGFWKMTIEGVGDYWKFTDDPGAYQDRYIEYEDIWNPY